jgi:hypothetical protein
VSVKPPSLRTTETDCVDSDLHDLMLVMATHRARWCGGDHVTQDDIESRLVMPSLKAEASAILAYLAQRPPS